MSTPILLLVGFAGGLLAFGLAAGVLLLIQAHFRRHVLRFCRPLLDGLTRMRGEVPWLDREVQLLSGGHAQHQAIFVSRHHLAEGGLECPLCKETYPSGDFGMVYRTMVDGRENEVIVCRGRRIIEDGREVPCGTLLVASPDTEHGDHLADDGTVDREGRHDPPEFYHFVRAPADQALREQWGVDARAGRDEHTVEVPDAKPKDAAP